MAVSEKNVTGKFYRIWSVADKLWHRISFWTHANDVEFNDGKTAQTKVGAIKGITTSTSATETGYAADATTVAALNQSLAVKTGTLTQISSYPLYMSYCYKVGNVVVIGFSLKTATTTKTNGTTIFNVPTGFRPLVDSWTIAFHSNGSNGYARLVFNTAGEVKVVNPNGYSVNAGTITYVCTE